MIFNLFLFYFVNIAVFYTANLENAEKIFVVTQQ